MTLTSYKWLIEDKKLIAYSQVKDNNYAQVTEYRAGKVSPLAFSD